MIAYYKIRNLLVLIVLVFITTSTTYAQSKPASNLSSEIQMQKELSLDKFTPMFISEIEAKTVDVKCFGNKVNFTEIIGLINMEINPPIDHSILSFNFISTKMKLNDFICLSTL